MAVKTIEWKDNCIRIIDQTKLPKKLVFINCRDVKALWKAIKTLQVRGAPALGVAGGFGAVLGIRDSKAKNFDEFIKELNRVCSYIGSSRPTAVNLFWGIERIERVAKENKKLSIPLLKKRLLKEAFKIWQEDRDTCRKMAKYGASLIKSGDTILTHCNAGALATADYGSALGVLYAAKAQGKRIKVYCDETRPLLQGSRLTAWELMRNKIDTTLICDNMAAGLMAKGEIDKVFVGADRIARNGDTANKIGTYSVAVLAKHHRIPFYVVAPVSTIDFKIKSGKEIPIEQRSADEVRSFGTRQTAPKNVKVYNPAFDVTPANLITAIITERGIARPKNLLKKLGDWFQP
jgi:methylthioribose-1-phosphate isomerase